MTLKSKHKSEYSALVNAIHRCHNTEHAAFHNYGERGIHVCEDWRGKDGFDKFLSHIGEKPSADLTLDRIDNDRGYEPGNVRWATRAEQVANRRHPQGNYPSGADHHAVKRCAARNAVIQEEWTAGATVPALARQYDLTVTQIYRVVRPLRTKH